MRHVVKEVEVARNCFKVAFKRNMEEGPVQNGVLGDISASVYNLDSLK